MPEQNSTQQLTITLPLALARLIQERVASGEYATESDFVRETIVSFTEAPWINPQAEAWLDQEILRQCSEADAHPENLLTPDEVRQAMDEVIASAKQQC